MDGARLSIPFAKMSGSGNDFVVIDHRERLLTEDEIAPFARAVCRRGLGLGADGVILIERTSRTDVDFRWRYVNADGSVGEMCGNGAMCGARFAVRHGIAPASCRFETDVGDVTAKVGASDDPSVAIWLADVGQPGRPVEIVAEERPVTFVPIVVGVPHAVAVVEDADAFMDTSAFARWGRLVRTHAAFGRAGTNVNAIHIVDHHTIRMRTYERGVEAETLACGTGAVASAVVAALAGLVAAPVTVKVSSGRSLMADFTLSRTATTGIRLVGEARFVAAGELDPEVFA